MGGPGASPIAGPEHSCRGSAAGAKPGVAVALDNQTGSARGKGPFLGQRRGHAVGFAQGPGLAAVVGRQDCVPAIDRITQNHAVVGVPEGHGVEKARGVAIRVLQGPGRAAVGCFVDPRLLPLADCQKERRPGIDGVNVAKIQGPRIGNSGRLPGCAAIDGAQDRAAVSARPGDIGSNNRDAAQTGLGAALLSHTLGSTQKGGACQGEGHRDGQGKTRGERTGHGLKSRRS